MIKEPAWLVEARKHIGLHEIKGPQNAAEIVQFWKDIKRGGIDNDETAWCAAFVGAMLERSGIKSTRYESAKSYLDWGEHLQTPAQGCIAVLTRDGGGHVAFVVGRASNGDLMLLGGNQSDQVCIRAFAPSRVTGYRWPCGVPDIPQGISNATCAERSESEA